MEEPKEIEEQNVEEEEEDKGCFWSLWDCFMCPNRAPPELNGQWTSYNTNHKEFHRITIANCCLYWYYYKTVLCCSICVRRRRSKGCMCVSNWKDEEGYIVPAICCLLCFPVRRCWYHHPEPKVVEKEMKLNDLTFSKRYSL